MSLLVDVDPLTHAALGDASEVAIDELQPQKEEGEEPGPDSESSQGKPPLRSSPSGAAHGAHSVREDRLWAPLS